MPRFFLTEIDPKKTEENKIYVVGADAAHISKSLRMKPGEKLLICDKQNREYACEITDLSRDRVTLTVLREAPSEAEPDIKITLFQSLLKADKFDTVIQKAVELGVWRVVPVLTERCVSRPDGDSFEKKRARWQKIAKESAMQCGRAIIPHIGDLTDVSGAFCEMAKADLSFVCYEGESRLSLKAFLEKTRGVSFSFLVGPEGGFSPKEISAARQLGISCVTLGKRILRAETAPLAVLSSVMFITGNLG